MSEFDLVDDEFINVNLLVPKHLVGAVYRAVADVVEGRSLSSTASPISLDNRFQWWPKNHITQLEQEIHNPTVLALLDLAAERADNWISFDEVYRKAGRTKREAMGDLAGFTQLIKRCFKQNEEGWWPVNIQQGTTPRGKQLQYFMPSEIAGYWKEARSR